MAIGFRAAGTFATRGSPGTGALSVGIPAGTAADDLMLLVATAYNTGTSGPPITTPSGWTIIDTKDPWATDYCTVLFRKVAGASEGAVSLSTGAVSCYLDAVTVGFTGVDPANPIDAAGIWSALINGATVTVPSITTAHANAWWVTVGVDAAGQVNSSSFPTGWTQRALTAITIAKYVINSILVAAAGATSATSYSRTGASAGHIVIGVALRPLVAAAPVADFTGTPLSGTATLAVTFTDSSTNSPTSWAWDFGDGGTSTSQNPSHSYTSAGTYTVSLVATNATGSDTKTRTGYVTVTETVAYATGAGIDII